MQALRLKVEDAEHFIVRCSVLQQERTCLLEAAPQAIKTWLSDSTPSSSAYCDFVLVQIMLGTCWVKDNEVQWFCIEFLQSYKLLEQTSCSSKIRSHSPIAEERKEKKKKIFGPPWSKYY